MLYIVFWTVMTVSFNPTVKFNNDGYIECTTISSYKEKKSKEFLE